MYPISVIDQLVFPNFEFKIVVVAGCYSEEKGE